MNIPIAHAHGGELTLGAYDNAIRHAITKMAAVHFVASDVYRHRVLQLGEDTANVFNVGALGLEHVLKTPRYSINELAEDLQLPLAKPYLLVTYHPETLGNETTEPTFEVLLQVLAKLSDYKVIFTYPNADNGAYTIIQLIESYCKTYPIRAFVARSLGYKRYHSAVCYAEAVIGNSSSGIIEVPSFNVPTVNIGIRQQGRVAAESIINAQPNYKSIDEAIEKALSTEFKAICKNVNNPYESGEVSAKIIPILKEHNLSTLKQFQDLD